MRIWEVVIFIHVKYYLMSNIVIWTGTSTFTTGSTPFGFYDTDALFATEADHVAKWCAQRLGYPVVEIE